jgi:hypothetical protein
MVEPHQLALWVLRIGQPFALKFNRLVCLALGLQGFTSRKQLLYAQGFGLGFSWR